MSISKNKYITADLDFAESKIENLKKWLEDNPYDAFQDRIAWKETKGGGTLPIVVASIEARQKNWRETAKEYLALLEVVNRLRTAEKAKEEMRKGFKNDGDILDDEDDDKQ